ncbi:MAG: hypothetical protein KH204_11035, partial [[Eubacterium] rectale]|nr:hypothetical protein [Agathobacter rectalis]
EAEYSGVLSLKSFAGPCHDTTESNFRKIINVNKLQKRGCDDLFFVFTFVPGHTVTVLACFHDICGAGHIYAYREHLD